VWGRVYIDCWCELHIFGETCPYRYFRSFVCRGGFYQPSTHPIDCLINPPPPGKSQRTFLAFNQSQGGCGWVVWGRVSIDCWCELHIFGETRPYRYFRSFVCRGGFYQPSTHQIDCLINPPPPCKSQRTFLAFNPSQGGCGWVVWGRVYLDCWCELHIFGETRPYRYFRSFVCRGGFYQPSTHQIDCLINPPPPCKSQRTFLAFNPSQGGCGWVVWGRVYLDCWCELHIFGETRPYIFLQMI